MKILVLNCGSSSVKFAVIDTISTNNIATGIIENLGLPTGRIKASSNKIAYKNDLGNIDHLKALQIMQSYLESLHIKPTDLDGIGHRVVSGGEKFSASVKITTEIIDGIKDCVKLAPLHNPAHLLGIQEAINVYPELPQVAVFDTAFHQTMPERAFTIAVPRVLYKEHAVRNYGYHGTSHRYVSAKAAQMLGIPYNKCALITAHLGNGCSIAAVLDGKCVDTSMGLTPCSGLVMGTRAGDVDGGLYPYLNSVMGWDIQKIYSMLNKESGILALSGLTHDMRTLVDASEEGHEGAILGIEVFCYTLAKKIAAYFVALGRTPDALIFTGGIGENSLPVREKTLSLLAPLGFVFDSNRNLDNGASSNGKVTSDKGIPGIVVATNEELLIAQDTEGVIKGA